MYLVNTTEGEAAKGRYGTQIPSITDFKPKAWMLPIILVALILSGIWAAYKVRSKWGG
jgi:hypothetical protein